ncbi:hypothetical protein BZG02_12380 [Labilibaculum filiforme]|uniref:HTH luxR-type domain-containing protein n=1 Tax=Labilibaculum filiforme TaxID=1940526 RepID=A0A2N3HWT6_9BACT|nr:hypothetical protein [Labilibaculum filiforme]PKQ62514.1 hypothetical protein BZG02_12380 [Labilibaculum filiforme]
MRSIAYKHLLIFTFVILVSSVVCGNVKNADRIQNQSDTIVTHFQIQLRKAEHAGDTIKIINYKQKMIRHLSGIGRFHQAYDNIWSLLPLVQTDEFAIEKLELFQKLTGLYIIFEQYEKAGSYIQQSFDLVDANIEEENLKAYHTGMIKGQQAWLLMKQSRNYEMAEKLLLEKLRLMHQAKASRNEIRYTNLQISELYLDMFRTEDAGNLLRTIYDEVGEAPMQIHALLFHYYGRYYKQLSKNDSSIFYLQKSIETIDFYHIHLDKRIDDLELLSECYVAKGDHEKALRYLLESKMLSDSLFGSKSTLNKELFEIKDKYTLRLQEEERKFDAQRLELLERKNQVWLYKLLSLIALSILIITVLLVYFNRQASKLRNEKLLLKKEQELEKQKQNVVLEVKNKELMSRALQMLERDTILNDLTQNIADLPNNDKTIGELKDLANSIKIDKSKKWEEFEIHFTSVNSQFFKLLRENFSKLTATDLKFCAFIKLGFSSKDMSELMGISPDSVNTSRSRIRKKMGLDRQTNIVEFLQKLEIIE